MKTIMTKTQIQKKYDAAKLEIIRLHDEIAVLRKRESETTVGVDQLMRSADAILKQIVLTRGADTGSGRELYISNADKKELDAWKLIADRTETTGILKLRVEPRK